MEARNTVYSSRDHASVRARRGGSWLLLAVLVVAGLGGAAAIVSLRRLDREIHLRLSRQLASQFPDLRVQIGNARRVGGRGIEIRGLMIATAEGQPLATVDELFVECNVDIPQLLTRSLGSSIDRVVVRHPVLHCRADDQGNWGLDSLRSLPSGSGRLPPIQIEDASLRFYGPGQPLVIQDLNFELIPDESGVELALHGSMSTDFATGITIDGTAQSDGSSWQLDGQVADLDFSPRVWSRLPANARQLIEPFAGLKATGSLKFQIKSPSEPSGSIRFSVAGTVRDGQFQDRRWPTPLTEMRADFTCNNERLELHQLSARNGATKIFLAGTQHGWQPDCLRNGRLRLRQLAVDSELLAALPETFQPLIPKFSPEGIVNIDLHLQTQD